MIKHVRLPSERGQHLVEFALVLPVLLMLLFGIIEFGIAVFSYNTIANVGREVARYGTVHANATDIDTYIADELPRWTTGLSDDPTKFNVDYALTGEGIESRIEVTVSYTYTFIAGPLIEAVGADPDLGLRSVTSMFTEVPFVAAP